MKSFVVTGPLNAYEQKLINKYLESMKNYHVCTQKFLMAKLISGETIHCISACVCVCGDDRTGVSHTAL